MTVIEAHVAEEHWVTLQEAYATRIQQLPPGIVQTFLVHSLIDSTVWQIVSVWTSREALLATRLPGQTPAGEQIFRAASAEPIHSIFDVAMQAKPG